MPRCPSPLLAALLLLGPLARPPAAAQVNVLTQHNDNVRSGANLNETALTPLNVNPAQFGLLFKRVVDDQLYAQPLCVADVAIGGGTHDVVYVATVNNSVYAFDAADPAVIAPYWQVNLGVAPNLTNNGGAWTCGNITGNSGIVGTPVIDVVTRTLYVVAERIDGTVMTHHLHALDLATGTEKFGGPVLIQADGFTSAIQLQRPGLLLSNGVVYIAFGSHCDQEAYHGYLFGYDARTLAQVAFFNTSPSGTEGSIWQSGQGPAADANGNIYVITGNGSWDGVQNWGESFLKLTPAPALTVADWFTPASWADLNTNDLDLGCSGAVLIPDLRLVMGGSKEGKLYLLNMDKLGNESPTDAGALQQFQAVTPPPPNATTNLDRVHGSAIYWNSAVNGLTVYLWGDSDFGRAFQLVNGRLNPTASITTAPTTAPINGTGIPGGILALSANGSTGGIVWASSVYSGNASSTVPGVLYAFEADNLSHLLWSSKMIPAQDDSGNLAKFATPTIANGKVYLSSFGNQSNGTGQLCVYGLRDFSLRASGGSGATAPGASATYAVTAAPLAGFNGSVSLHVTGLPPGATAAFTPAAIAGSSGSATLTVTLANPTAAGAYLPTITGTSGAQSHTTIAPLDVGAATAGLINLSGRGIAASGSNGLTAGTVVPGPAGKSMLIRGVGPALSAFGLPTPLADPTLTVYDSSGRVLAANSGWSLSPNAFLIAAAAATAGAFALPNGSADSAALLTLGPGSYTFQVESTHGNSGTVMLEAYDLDPPSPGTLRMTNASTLGQVGAGPNSLTAGLVVQGSGSRMILIRGIGPSLARFGIGGVLADPQLRILAGDGTVLAANDDWGLPTVVNGRTVTGDVIRAATAAVGAFTLDSSKESALLISLTPGNYTIQLFGTGNSTGLGLIEAYEVPF